MSESIADALVRFVALYGRSDWLVSAEIGTTDDGRPALVARVRSRSDRRRLGVMVAEFEGWPVVVRDQT